MNKPSKPNLSPLYVIIIGILAASTASLFIRQAQAYSPSIVIATYRLGLATLFLLPVALTKRRFELSTITRHEFFLSLVAGIFLAIHFSTWILSLEFTTVASSVVLVSTAPFWVALLSPITIKEPISKMILAGMGLTFMGLLIVVVGDSCTWVKSGLQCPSPSEFIRGSAFWGDILALIGAIAAAIYLIIGRSLRVRVSLVSYVFVVYGMAAVVLLLLMLASGNSLVGYPPVAYLWFLLLALVPQLLGHSAINWALEYLSAAYVAITLLGEPIGSTILAFLFLDETPSEIKIAGGILILIGIYIASKSEKEVVSTEAGVINL